MADKTLNLNLNLNPTLNVADVKRTLAVLENDLSKVGKTLKIDGLNNVAKELNNIKVNVDATGLNKLQTEIQETATEAKKTETALEGIGQEVDALNNKKVKIPIEQPTTPSLPDGVTTDKNGRLRKGGKYWKDPNATDEDNGSTTTKNTDKLSKGINLKSIAVGAAVGGGAALAAQGLQQVMSIGVEFEKSLADMSAITGVTGKDLDGFGNKARELAKQFGGSAAEQVESFKGILSKLGPDIAKSPEALNSMAISVNTLAKASGLDATTSMNALATAAQQFGVDLSNPKEAAKAMSEQMNIMAAGAKEGAAEVPAIAEAIQVAGVAASGAKISFGETNAAIQTLAAGGLQGAEAGTALRNVILGLQNQSVEGETELNKLGLSTLGLGKTIREKGLGAALNELNTKLAGVTDETKRTQIVTTLFGKENSSAAGIMLRSADAMGTMQKKIEGTNTAFDQAKTNMATTGASFERIKAQAEDFAIGLFQSLAPALQPLLNAITNDILPALKPVFDVLGKLVAKYVPIIVKVLGNIMPVIIPILDLVLSLVDAVLPLIDVALILVGAALKPIGEIIKILTPIIIDLVDIIVAILVPILRDLSPVITDIIMVVAELLKIAATLIITFINIAKFILTTVASFLGFKNAGELVTGITRTLIKVFGFFIGVVKNFYKFINSAVQAILKFAKSLGQLLGIIDKEKKATKESSKAKKEQKDTLKDSNKAITDNAAAIALDTTATDTNTKATGSNTKAKEQQKKTLFDLFEAQKKINENSLKELQQQKELELATKGREKNIYDEVEALNNRKKVAEANLKAFNDLFKVNDKGEIGAKLNTDELEKAKDTLKGLNSELVDLKIEDIELKAKLKVTDEEYQKSIDDLSNKEIEAGIKLKVTTEVELAGYESIIEKAKNEVNNLKTEIAKGDKSEADTFELKNQLIQQGTIIADYTKKINDIRKKQSEDAVKVIEQNTNNEISALEKRAEAEANIINRILENLNKSFEAKIDSKLDQQVKAIDDAESEKIKILDQRREEDLISEEAYNKQKNDIIKRNEEERSKLTETAENKKLVLSKQTEGFIVEQTRQSELSKLAITKQGIEDKLKVATTDEEKSTLTKQLDDTTAAITEKSSLLLSYSTQLQTGMTDIFSNLFAGDTEQAKDGFRGILAVAAGGLEKLASAAATEIILGQLGIAGATTGFAGLLAIPLITALVNSAISAIIRPITSNLLSFSTGGRVDSPQLAMIGDAKNSGSFTNSEWIFNDKLIKMFTGSVIADYQKADFRNNNMSNYMVSADGKLTELSQIVKNSLQYKINDIPKISNINKIEIDGMRNLQLQTNKQLNEISGKLNESVYNRELLRLKNIEKNLNKDINVTVSGGKTKRRKPQFT